MTRKTGTGTYSVVYVPVPFCVRKTELNEFADHCLTETLQIQSDALTLVNTLTGQMVAIISAMDAYLSGGGSTSPSTSPAAATTTTTAGASPAGAAPSAPPSSSYPTLMESLGYSLQATVGTIGMVAGVTLAAGGGFVEVVSLGMATPVAVPAMGLGTIMAVYCGDMTTNALYNVSVNPADRVEMITHRGAHALGFSDGELLAFAPMVTGIQLAPRIPAAATLVDEAESLTRKLAIPNYRDNAAHNVASFEIYKDQLRAVMGKPHANDAKLAGYLDELYRPNATVGSGSTAAAVRHELSTGLSVGGKTHSQKARDMILALQRWLANNPNASLGDRAAAENVIRDMANALDGH